MLEQSQFEFAKIIIKDAIHKNLNFAELRNKLPEWHKRPLQNIVFDVMDELGIDKIPFAGMVQRPRLSRPGISVSQDGNICIAELLHEKGFLPDECIAYAHVGKTKITLTIKPKKSGINKGDK